MLGKAILGAAFIAFISIPSAFYSHGTVGNLTATVTQAERICESGRDGDCRWMILTDKKSFKNTDSFWHLKFNSTDVQGSVQVGEMYNFEYYGWRSGLLSLYPNIIGVTKVE